MPALVVPQILVCGLFVPRSQLPGVLHAISDVLPLSYAVDAMRHLTVGAASTGVAGDLGVVVGYAIALLVLGAATLRRRTP
jgi:ABC-2 type transport system permease protein